jgi:hypothetical protein
MSRPGVETAFQFPRRRINMKHLLTGVAVIAALAFCAPAGAQPASPSGGNALGLPGPNPGGPGLTPYSTGPGRPAAAPAPMAPAPSAAMPPPAMSDTSSAMPPRHRHARTSSHKMGKAAHHPSRFPNLQGNNVANELNQAELARLQSGNFSPPAPPPGPDMGSMGGPTSAGGAPRTTGNRMPAGGRTTSDRYGR